MRLNVFEGARRIALAVGVLWVGGCVAYAIFTEPYVRLDYSINGLNAVPVQVENCGPEDGSEYFSTEDSKGTSVNVKLCFKAHKADSGEWLIPYAAAENGRWWMAGQYSTEVTRYMKAREASFRLPPQGMEEARKLRWEKRLDQWKDGAMLAAAGVAIGWALIAVVGWVVRGFLGIPRGKDSRPRSPGAEGLP